MFICVSVLIVIVFRQCIMFVSMQGCPSWKWFYPYHYAPFSSDFKNITRVCNDFDKGTTPFAPLEQLMGVFPASSGKFLPQSWREIMMRDVDLHTLSSLPPSLSIPLSLPPSSLLPLPLSIAPSLPLIPCHYPFLGFSHH